MSHGKTRPASAVPPWADPQRFRRNNFDAMRFVFAVMVILSHAWPLTGRHYDGEPGAVLLNVSLGEIAVAAFFVISGFLIAASEAYSRRLTHFLKKRVLRIYPGWLVAFAATALVVAPLGGMPLGEVLSPPSLQRETLRAALLTQPYLPGAFADLPYHAANGSMWTIKYEFGCYLLVAALGAFGLARRRFALLGGLAAALALSAVVKVTEWAPLDHRLWRVTGWPQHWPYFLGFFLAGAAFFRFRRRIPCRGDVALVAGAVAVASARIDLLRAALLPLALAYVLLWLAYTPRIRVHGFARHGDFSYGIYLYAFPVQQLLIRSVPAASNPWLNFALAAPVAIALGALSWRFVERPMLRLKDRPLRRPAPQEATTGD